MSKFTGNIIRLPAVTPTQNSASGVYTLDDQFTAQSSGTWPIVRDQYFNYTTLLLTGAVQGTAYPNPVTQPYSFLSDASTNNFVVSPNGDVSARPFNPYLNNYSAFFDGTNDYCSLAGSADFSIPTSTTPFTVEAWIYPTSTSAVSVIWTERYNGAGNTVSLACGLMDGSSFWTAGRYPGFSYYNGSGWTGAASNAQVELNTWSHVAYVFTGSACKIFLNGLDVTKAGGPTTWAITGVSGEAWYIGSNWDVATYFSGYISNLRYVVGTAVYTSNFTPSTAPLQNITNTKLLACQSNRFIDNSSSPKTITPVNGVAVSQNSPFVSYDTTNGSGYFDGTGDYLSVADNTALDMEASDFTMECWVYLSETPSSADGIFAKRTDIGTFGGVLIFFNGLTPNFYATLNGSSWGIAFSSSISATLNAWTHLAFTRSGSTWTIYVNGVSGGTGNSSGTVPNNTSAFVVGAYSSDGNATYLFPAGYISNVRVVKGTAIAPPAGGPTAPLQAVTNTSLLTLQTRAPATNNGFIDSSPNNFVVTRNGNTTQGSFSPFSPTGWGNYFNGSGDYLSTANTASVQFGTGDFTIEHWLYTTALGTSRWIYECRASAGAGPYFLCISTAGAYVFHDGTDRIGSTGKAQLNTWQHVAVVRASGTLSIYVNGVLDASFSAGTSLNPTGSFKIGADVSLAAVNFYSGYISNFRIVKGVAVYTGAFTPPTSPLSSTQSAGPTGSNIAAITGSQTSLLTCQSNRFRDASTNNFTITTSGPPSVQAFSPFAPAQSYIPSQIGGSGYFDGNADYLTAPSGPSFNFGTGDFTIECWVYQLSRTAAEYDVVWTLNGPGVTGTVPFRSGMYLSLGAAGGGLLVANSSENGWSVNISVTLPTLFTWEHYAVTRSGNTWTVYKNGQSVGSANSSAGVINSRAPFTIGTQGTEGNNYFDGYISGFRVVNGTALYTSNFTVPTAPPTAIPNTSLLLNFTNGGIVDATGKNNLETVANSGVQTSVIKYGNGSMYFDGGTDCLFEPSSTNYGYGSGDFTIEFWLRLNNTGTQTIVSNLTTAASVAPHIYYQVSSNIRYFTNGADRITGSALNANQWYHIAVCRFSSNTKMFVDGSQVGSTYPDTNNYGASNPLGVGDYGVPLSGVSTLNGYISNLRITKYARYTTNFNTNLPPGPFPLG